MTTSRKAALDGFFNDFTKHPPRWLCMLTACVDESFTKENGLYVVAGYLGDRESWERYTDAWPKALGKNRSTLHLKAMRLGAATAPSRHGDLLKRLGAVPFDCGLVALSGSVCVHDYAHLVQGTALELLMEGYILAMLAFMDNVAAHLEPSDKVEILLEQQIIHAEQVARAMKHWGDRHKTVNGEPVLSSYRTTPKTVLTEAADYLCYALTQRINDQTAQKAVLTAPILDYQTCVGNHWSKEVTVNIVESLQRARASAIPALTAGVKKSIRSPR